MTGKNLLEPRLLALFSTYDVDASTMDIFGDNKVKTLQIFTCLSKDEGGFRALLERAPFNFKSDDLEGIVEQAKLVAAWGAAKITMQVSTEQDAKRALSDLPPEVQKGEMETAVKLFEADPNGFDLDKLSTPSKGYYARKNAQAEAYFEAEPLTSVTNATMKDFNASSTFGIDVASGTLRATAGKDFAIPQPASAEALRARLTLMGICTVMSKMKYPNKVVLQSATMSLFEGYIRYLFGPKVWGLAVKD